MNKKDKEYTFKASVAGGLVAGGTLLAYQLLLNNGILIAGFGAIIAGFLIIYLSKRILSKK